MPSSIRASSRTGSMLLCESCSQWLDVSRFSNKMRAKSASKKCLGCVAAAEAQERKAAIENAAASGSAGDAAETLRCLLSAPPYVHSEPAGEQQNRNNWPRSKGTPRQLVTGHLCSIPMSIPMSMRISMHARLCTCGHMSFVNIDVRFSTYTSARVSKLMSTQIPMQVPPSVACARRCVCTHIRIHIYAHVCTHVVYCTAARSVARQSRQRSSPRRSAVGKTPNVDACRALKWGVLLRLRTRLWPTKAIREDVRCPRARLKNPLPKSAAARSTCTKRRKNQDSQPIRPTTPWTSARTTPWPRTCGRRSARGCESSSDTTGSRQLLPFA